MIKPNKKKYQFVLNVWIAGMFNGLEVIGRTCLIDNEQMITIINTDGIAMSVSFHDIDKPYAIRVDIAPIPKLATKIQEDELVPILARKQTNPN